MMQKKKQIVIIESSVSDMLTKIAYSLRKKGYETVFISLVGGIEKEFVKEAYDKVISFDFKFFKLNPKNLPKIFYYFLKKSPQILKAMFEIKKLKPYIVIGRATPNWLCFLAKKYFDKYPFVYFPGDIRSFSFKSTEEAFSSGVPKFEIKAESHCFNESDGIIHKGDEDELNFLKEKVLGKINIKCPSIYFFPYCLNDFFVDINTKNKLSYKDKKIHVVYAGHIPSDSNWIDGLIKLTNQKLCLHLYGKTNNLTKFEDKERIVKSHGNFLKHEFLFLNEPVNQEKLSKEIAKYDYGTYTYSSAPEKNMEYATGNKISSYLEAGIPILCSKSYVSAVKVLKKYNTAIIYNPLDIGSIRKQLEKNKPSKFRNKILRARKELSMENHIPRLEKFFEKVREYKFKNKK